MIRRTALLIVVVAIAAACSSADEPAATDAVPAESTQPAPATTAEPSPTTTTAASAATEPAEIEDLLGVGDSLYPTLGNRGYDADHYTIDLTFDPEPNTINALVEIEATATLAIQSFSLDFIGFETTRVTVDDVEVDFERRDNKLIVHSPTVIPAGEAFTVAVAYEGTPTPMRSEALPFTGGWLTDSKGVSYVIAEPDGARTWYPVNDHPTDKATYTFMITVPDPLIAAANGTLVETITDLGWATWVWESAEPMASYLATVIVGDRDIVEDTASTSLAGIPVRNVLPDDLSEASLEVLAKHGEMIAFFETIYGPYPFAAYGIAVVDDFDAALENQTLSIFGRFFVDIPQFFEIVMVHELAHQWFGNSVTPADWGDIWLNEGFATYAEWLWIEHTAGEAAMLSQIAVERDRMAVSALPPPGSPPSDDLFNASVYIRGGLVLHALRVEVGDEAFFAIVREYADTYRNDVVTTNDFITLAESISGQDLDDLFDKWLYGEDVPELPRQGANS
ncbi:MAG: M1 family metallopeptidase [Acidimicrobiia bacterium]|nr:M1 family metallopeptidase [Acidimicrobiia bacterium]